MRRLAGAAEAVCWLIAATVLLRLVPFNRLFREVPAGGASPPLDPARRDTVVRIRSVVTGAARRMPWHPACLPQSLAAALMCRARGMRIPIALSVVNQGRFSAHARLDAATDAELAILTPEGRTHLGRITLSF